MTFLAWTADLNTGIDVIDGQHRQIVDFINDLYIARTKGDRAGVSGVIDGLVDYTLSHFAFEETLMRDAGYQFLHGHQKIHEVFVHRVNRLQERFKAGEDVGEELLGMLSRWLVHHIRNDDAAYVEAVKGSMQKLVAEQSEGGWLQRSLTRFFGRK